METGPRLKLSEALIIKPYFDHTNFGSNNQPLHFEFFYHSNNIKVSFKESSSNRLPLKEIYTVTNFDQTHLNGHFCVRVCTYFLNNPHVFTSVNSRRTGTLTSPPYLKPN